MLDFTLLQKLLKPLVGHFTVVTTYIGSSDQGTLDHL